MSERINAVNLSSKQLEYCCNKHWHDSFVLTLVSLSSKLGTDGIVSKSYYLDDMHTESMPRSWIADSIRDRQECFRYLTNPCCATFEYHSVIIKKRPFSIAPIHT